MCYFKSMILLKDRVFIGDTDSHSDMLEKLGLRDDHSFGTPPDFVKVEIIPPKNDFTAPVDHWIYTVDQDFLPTWYVKELDSPRCFEALKTWATSHIFVGQSFGEIKDETIYLSNCTVSHVSGGLIGEARNCTIDRMTGGTIDKMTGGTIDRMYNGTICRLIEGSVKYMSGGVIRDVRRGIIHQLLNGKVNLLFDGAINTMAGGVVGRNRGIVFFMSGGEIYEMRAGTVRRMDGGIITQLDDGVVDRMYGGTISYLRGGIIGYVFKGTIKEMSGGTVTQLVAQRPDDANLQKLVDGLCITGKNTIIVGKGKKNRYQIKEAQNESPKTFKAGDMITGTVESDRHHSIVNSRMIRGRVVSSGTVTNPHHIEVEVVEHTDHDKVGRCFFVDDRYFVLADSPSPAEETK